MAIYFQGRRLAVHAAVKAYLSKGGQAPPSLLAGRFRFTSITASCGTMARLTDFLEHCGVLQAWHKIALEKNNSRILHGISGLIVSQGIRVSI